MDRARILVISLGGTIAMTASADSAVRPSLDAADLVAGVPADLAGRVAITTRSFARVPSADLGLADVIRLAAAVDAAVSGGDDVHGVVITQGTDTIEEVAFGLDLLLATDVPVVVTGAMRNPSQPGPDGPANLADAIVVASSPFARGLGTLVAFGGEVHAAPFVRKTRAVTSGAFESVTGPLGWVAESTLQLAARRSTRPHVATVPAAAPGTAAGPDTPAVPVPPDAAVPAVALVRIALGDDGRLLRAVPDLGYHALVVEAMGAGHVPAALVADLVRINASVPVVVCSRTGRGSVLRHTYGFPGSEQDLLDRGLTSAGYLDGLKARIALALLLRARTTRDGIAAFFADGFGALA